MTTPDFSAAPAPTLPQVLHLPGWQNSGPGHWQSHWERLYGEPRVQQDDWLWPKRGDWMARLDEALLARPAPDGTPTPVVLVAHSLGCHLVAAWAAHSQHRTRVQAALLVAPPDVQRQDWPPQLSSWRVPVLQPLPFRSLVLASTNDAYADEACSAQMASAWGSQWLSLGALGHLNGESGLGEWPQGRELLWALIDRAV
jgi:uncharacterized protein